MPTVYVPIEVRYPIEAHPLFENKNGTRIYIFVIRWKGFPTKATYTRCVYLYTCMSVNRACASVLLYKLYSR